MSHLPNFSVPPPSIPPTGNPNLRFSTFQNANGPTPSAQMYPNDPSQMSMQYYQSGNSQSGESWAYNYYNNTNAPNQYPINNQPADTYQNTYPNYGATQNMYPTLTNDQMNLPLPHLVNLNVPPPSAVDILRPPPTYPNLREQQEIRHNSQEPHSSKSRISNYVPSKHKDTRYSHRSSADYDAHRSSKDSSSRYNSSGRFPSSRSKEYDNRYRKDRHSEYGSKEPSRNSSERGSYSQRSSRESSSYSRSYNSRDGYPHSSHRYHKSPSVRTSDRIDDREVRSLRSVEPSLKRLSPSRSKCHGSSSDKRNDGDKKKSDAFCSNMQEVYESMDKNIADQSEDDELSKQWYRSSPADLYYVAVEGQRNVMESTARGRKLAESMKEMLIDRGRNARPCPRDESLAPPRPHRPRLCKHKSEQLSSSGSSSSSESDEADHAMQELERKQQHPRRLHPEMWYNDPGDMNDGPLCRCSARTRRQGIRHGVYAGEERPPPCNPHSNNADKLYHYRVTISPPTNFLIKTLTVITHDEHEFLFSGFSMLSHYPLTKLPTCKVIRFNIEYTILYLEEQPPLNYTVKELELFEEFLFREILELVDLDMGSRDETGCSQFHLLPRWERALDGGGGEVLAVAEVIRHLMNAGGPLLPECALPALRAANQREWQTFVDGVRGMIVTYPGKKPCSVRVDQLDRSLAEEEVKQNSKKSRSSREISDTDIDLTYPEIVHFGIRPPQLSYAGNPEYKKAWRDYVKFRHLAANMPKPSYEDKRKLEAKEAKLQEMRTQSKMKRDVTVAVSAEGFYRTGLMCDVVQHAMLIPVLISHLRFHNSLSNLEKTIDYKFENRSLLQLALTHPSYRENFGTNPDHARNSLTNCGIRQPEYGDRRIHYLNIRKRGINTLINIMSRFGKKQETESAINHNERLEFLGDAVVEFLSSIHLFKMFPSLEEGGLATYRAAIVQNQHLAQLAKKLGLDQYMLYAHGSDLCHDLELRHAMANCFEALMGALFLDGGIDVADRVFGLALWQDSPELLESWRRPRPHPLQEQEPLGDRRWVQQYPFLQNLTKFEDSIGVKFKHIRLLARAFTDRSMGFTNLTLGSNQRLEFLGDTVLQLISSDHLYKHFPEHHEGHLSLLRSSLVNNRTQAVVCDDLAMASYAVYHNPKAEPKTKDKADLLEAFLGALYIDKNIEYCLAFCSVCLFPRLREFIMNQEWNDPKSKLQQCCLTLRTMDGSEPDIPIYKVIECVGPTNTRVYSVAVYFRGERLASARGHCIQEAEMNAAKQAISNSQSLFPQLDHQKRVIAKSMKHQKKKNYQSSSRHGGKEGSERRGHRRRRSGSDTSRLTAESVGNSSGKRFSSRSSRDKDKLPMAYRTNKPHDSDNDSVSNVSSVSQIYSSSDSEPEADTQQQDSDAGDESKSKE